MSTKVLRKQSWKYVSTILYRMTTEEIGKELLEYLISLTNSIWSAVIRNGRTSFRLKNHHNFCPSYCWQNHVSNFCPCLFCGPKQFYWQGLSENGRIIPLSQHENKNNIHSFVYIYIAVGDPVVKIGGLGSH